MSASTCVKETEALHEDARLSALVEGMTVNQSEAVCSGARLTIVDAGAGSGKTSVIVRRAVALAIRHPHEHVIMTTFTREAVSEMSDRLYRLLEDVEGGEEIRKRIHIMTLGGLAFKVAADKDLKISLNGGISYAAIIKKMLSNKIRFPFVSGGKAEKTSTYAQMLATAISLMQANGYDPDSDMIEDEWVKEGYRLYIESMHEARQTSLGLLQKNAALRLAENIDCLGFGEKLHVLVDEAQDCCLSQYNMVLFLARYGSLTLVGDDAQAIYGWRGSVPGIMRGFPRIGVCSEHVVRYESNETVSIQLEDNFRSTQAIIDVAKAPVLVEAKLSKIMRGQRGIGDRVDVLNYPTKLSEAKGVLSRIDLYMSALGIEAGSVAVIGRSHAALDEVANQMRSRNMPFVYLNGGFFERREYLMMRDFAFFVEDIAHQKDVRESLSKFVSTVTGKACDLKQIEMEPSETISRRDRETTAYVDAACKRKALVDVHIKEGFSRLMSFVLDSVRKSGSQRKPFYYEAMRLMISTMDVRDRCAAMGEYHIENTIEALLMIAKEADRDGLRMTGILSEYEAQERGPRVPSCITLGTPFAMKGLEFDLVIIVGASDGLFPSSHCVGDGCVDFRSDPFRHTTYGDEARNFFVAATRAKRNLVITYSLGTSIGSNRKRMRSRFIDQAFTQIEKTHGAKKRDEYIKERNGSMLLTSSSP